MNAPQAASAPATGAAGRPATSPESPGCATGGREALVREFRALYAALDAEIAARRPVCRASGGCCRFEAYGHRLYATRAEALYFGAVHGAPRAVFSHDCCPYQENGLCTARDGRPLGCRVFFCDPAYKGQGEELTERYLRRIREVSARLGIAWDYAPFMTHLDGLRETAGAAGGDLEETWRS